MSDKERPILNTLLGPEVVIPVVLVIATVVLVMFYPESMWWIAPACLLGGWLGAGRDR